MKARVDSKIEGKSIDGLLEALNMASRQAMQDMLEKIQAQSGDGMTQSWQTITTHLAQHPDLLADLQQRYYQQQMSLWMNMLGVSSPAASPPITDKRFSDVPIYQAIVSQHFATHVGSGRKSRP
jgi:hypothetical protein